MGFICLGWYISTAFSHEQISKDFKVLLCKNKIHGFTMTESNVSEIFLVPGAHKIQNCTRPALVAIIIIVIIPCVWGGVGGCVCACVCF